MSVTGSSDRGPASGCGRDPCGFAYFAYNANAGFRRTFGPILDLHAGLKRWMLPWLDRRHGVQQVNRELVHHCWSPQELSSLSKIDTIS